MRLLYRMSRNSFVKLTSSRLDEWRQLSRWRTSTSLFIGGSTAFKINEKISRNNGNYWKICKKRICYVYRKKIHPSESLFSQTQTMIRKTFFFLCFFFVFIQTKHQWKNLILYQTSGDICHCEHSPLGANSFLLEYALSTLFRVDLVFRKSKEEVIIQRAHAVDETSH